MSEGLPYSGQSPLPGFYLKTELIVMTPWYSPQCRELHSELDNLSDEYLSCLRKLQHCREELNHSQQLPPRVRGSILLYNPKWWWDDFFFSQVLQIKYASLCQCLVILPTLLDLVHAESTAIIKETLMYPSPIPWNS